MDEDVIRAKVKNLIYESPNKNTGFLIGLFNKENKGKGFDNKTVSKIINEELLIV